ncbi:MAG TPA: hypothetical protein V6C65_23845 [Allocoleopsis sp.]
MSPSRAGLCIEQAIEPRNERRPDRVKLPEPDLKNITALTENLPNVPILPWNHYDNPQVEAEEDI